MLIRLGKMGQSPSVLGAISSAGSSFVPTDITGLDLWLDAADTSTISETSNVVTQWRDKSGNDHHANPYVGAAEPDSGTRTYNEKNVLDFQTPGEVLDVLYPNLNHLSNADNTVIIVMCSDSNSQSGYALGGEASGGADRFFMGVQSGGIRVWNGYNTGAWIDSPFNDTNPHIVVQNKNTTETYGYFDGVLMDDAPRPANLTDNLGSLTIGAMNAAGNNDLDGWIGEILIYDSVLGSAELNQVYAYLALKWGIPLPADDYDVFLLAGQSNMVGFNGDGTVDGPNPKIFEIDRDGNATLDKKIKLAEQPLQHDGGSAGHIGLGYTFAEQYIADNPDKKVILVPTARGTTGFSSGEWTVATGSRYLDAVDRANEVMSYGTGTKTFKGILWHQGEQDTSMSQAAYAAALDAMVAGLRADITGASSAPFICGDLLPGWNLPSSQSVRDALADTPNRDANSAFVASTSLADGGDGIHFDAPSLRILGQRYYDAFTAP
ncbi:MAG: hypothetical protein GC137_09970 [Alphaproteobacteria bacterium]|nr:hypothetical protein [Alphaproteobacteria bacterium]